MSFIKFILKSIFWLFLIIILVGVLHDPDDKEGSSSSSTPNGQQSALHRMVHGDISTNDKLSRSNSNTIPSIDPSEFKGRNANVEILYSVDDSNFITVNGQTNLPPYTIFALHVRRGAGHKADVSGLMIDENGKFQHTFRYDITNQESFLQPIGEEMNIRFYTMSHWQDRLREQNHKSYSQGENIRVSLESMNGLNFDSGSVLSGYKLSKVFPFNEKKLR